MAYMHMIERMLLSGAYNEALIKEQALKKLTMRLKAEDDRKRLSDEERAGKEKLPSSYRPSLGGQGVDRHRRVND